MGKILLMEDEPNHIFIVQHSLQRVGHEVVACSQPANFMTVLKQTQPDIVLMDINLPMIDGFTLIQEVRKHLEYASLPIIVLTAIPLDDVRAKAQAMGSDMFLEKPIRIQALRRVIEEVLVAKTPEI